MLTGHQAPHWHDVTALYGGTFDPPHLGHREAVRGLFASPGVKRVLVLPSASPPHKTGTTEATHRIAMCRLNFAATPSAPFPSDVEIDLRELVRAGQTGRPSYTYDTLLEIGREIPQIAFVIGTDWLEGLMHWHRFPEVLKLSHWIILKRKPDGERLASPFLSQWESSGLIRKVPSRDGNPTWQIAKGATFLTLAPTDAPAMAAHDIREAIALKGEAPENTILPEVRAYLMQNRLYGTKAI